jgi:DNA-binding GntR family transcriptional regulator
MNKVKKINNFTLRDLAYNSIKEYILQGDLKPGKKIFQEKMADELGISKIPIIQALALLEMEGILKKIPQKGFFVRKVSKDEILKINDIRIIFEEIGIRKLIENPKKENNEKLSKYLSNFDKYQKNKNKKSYILEDLAFHHFFIESSGFEIIEKTLDNLGVFTVVFMKGIPGLENSYKDHKIIINGVLENDCEKAVSGLKDHINRIKNKIIEMR